MEQDGSLRSNLYLHRQRSHSYTIANKILLISIMRLRESCLSCTSAIIHFVSSKVQKYRLPLFGSEMELAYMLTVSSIFL